MPVSEGFLDLNQTSILSSSLCTLQMGPGVISTVKAHSTLLTNTLGQHRKAWFECDNCLLSLHSVLEAPHSEVRLTDTRSQKQRKCLTSGVKKISLNSVQVKTSKNTSHSANGGSPLGRRVKAAREEGVHTLQHASILPSMVCVHAITHTLK